MDYVMTCGGYQIRPWAAGMDRPLLAQLAPGRVEASLHLLDHRVDAETRRTLARRIVLERLKELADRRQHAVQDPGIGHEPVVIRVRGNIGPLVGVGAQIEHLREAQLGKGFGPNAHGSGCPLFFENHFPVLVAHRDDIAVIVEIDELFSRAVRLLAG